MTTVPIIHNNLLSSRSMSPQARLMSLREALGSATLHDVALIVQIASESRAPELYGEVSVEQIMQMTELEVVEFMESRLNVLGTNTTSSEKVELPESELVTNNLIDSTFMTNTLDTLESGTNGWSDQPAGASLEEYANMPEINPQYDSVRTAPTNIRSPLAEGIITAPQHLKGSVSLGIGLNRGIYAMVPGQDIPLTEENLIQIMFSKWSVKNLVTGSSINIYDPVASAIDDYLQVCMRNHRIFNTIQFQGNSDVTLLWDDTNRNIMGTTVFASGIRQHLDAGIVGSMLFTPNQLKMLIAATMLTTYAIDGSYYIANSAKVFDGVTDKDRIDSTAGMVYQQAALMLDSLAITYRPLSANWLRRIGIHRLNPTEPSVPIGIAGMQNVDHWLDITLDQVFALSVQRMKESVELGTYVDVAVPVRANITQTVIRPGQSTVSYPHISVKLLLVRDILARYRELSMTDNQMSFPGLYGYGVQVDAFIETVLVALAWLETLLGTKMWIRDPESATPDSIGEMLPLLKGHYDTGVRLRQETAQTKSPYSWLAPLSIRSNKY